MEEIIRLIQKQIPLGTNITLHLKTGKEVSGILTEISLNHVTLKSEGQIKTIIAEMIGMWEELTDSSDQIESFAYDKTNKLKDVPQSQDITNQELDKQLIEIKARFNAELQVANINELKNPDFILPDDEIIGKQAHDAKNIWNKLREKYNYAVKVNELSEKFGRIQPILHEMIALSGRFPNSPSIKRQLAYILWLCKDYKKALDLYKETAAKSKELIDWYNLAVLGIINGNEELACYGLENYFYNVKFFQEMKAWYVLVKLINEHSNYGILNNILINKGTNISDEEINIMIETGIYLLLCINNNDSAINILRDRSENKEAITIIKNMLNFLGEQLGEGYQIIKSELTELEEDNHLEKEDNHQPQGYIYNFKRDRNYGFLEGIDGDDYFFHRSAILDNELLDKVLYLNPGERIPVIFDVAQGIKGPVAIRILMFRTMDEMLSRASEYANEGDYPQAIAQINKLIEIDPEYPSAKELQNKWREYTRVTGVPKGSTPYARAKRAQLIEKDLDKAVQLLREAIKRGDNTESAVKDLASVLVQQGKPEEAIKTLESHKQVSSDPKSIDNLLITSYQNAGQYDHAITLLQKKLKQADNEIKRAPYLFQIALMNLKKGDYGQSEQFFRKILTKQPDNVTVQRNIAICLSKQGHYDEAKKLLQKILNISTDVKSAEILEAINQAIAGQPVKIDEIVIETTLTAFSGDISRFTRFFLDRCKYEGVQADRVQKQTFSPHDIKKLEELATKLGTSRPSDRAAYYLSAAKIASLLEEGDPNYFSRYLGRCFASKGDAIVIEGRPLAAARAYYAEALSAYDGDRKSKDEQDAVNALVRFLYSTLGQTNIPMKPNIPSIDETLDFVLTNHPEGVKVFNSIAYLVFRSRYAANRILNRLYDKASHQAMALEFLKSAEISAGKSSMKLNDFVTLWNMLQKKSAEAARNVSNEVRLLSNMEFTTASLENILQVIKKLSERPSIDLDQERMLQLRNIFETSLELCNQTTFEEKERLSLQIGNRCQDLLMEIENSPTKFSVEDLFPVIWEIKNKAASYLEELYKSSMPQLTLRLPVESYFPDNNQDIEVQIAVNNRIGCSPAEALELIIQQQEHEAAFDLKVPDIKLDRSLRGAEQFILRVPLHLSKETINSQTFSLPVYTQYRTRSGEVISTSIKNFSIRLYSETEFEKIDNPYAAYAEGGIVGDPRMFYGREELIINVAKTIMESRLQSKCVVIFGQARAGKSSILHHLKTKLTSNKELLIIDIGNIGKILDDHSKIPLLYQILFEILRKLEYALEDKVSNGFASLGITIPSEKGFYEHHSPLSLFRNIFEKFRRSCEKSQEWRNSRIILLIDEFSYIYGYITAGSLPENFMKNWKALLQENYFSAVLVGQDVMPKFKQRFPNEFGIAQDERVTYLKREDAIKLIDEPIRIGGRQGESRYREKAMDRIINLTAGSPFYIQILCNRLVDYMNRKHARLVTEADIEQVKDDLIRGPNALDLDKFDNLLNSGDTSEDAISNEDANKVLTAIAFNSKTGPCNRYNILCETSKPVDEILDDLVKREVIEREGGQYYLIQVGLFNEWLIAHQ
ncbi:tetratricopeptide repeat protein [Desulfobacca acetoxidans]|uniref:Cold-shock protein DNA-binding protein n=1 Tax=Desulfobacca acetoxidans (strain ATCC 700848 / DSM 11109 / ASRB2) TaxID=880072 RepID=F2ND39_DESAR|nr:tetratricopeptide repeat protein [Desulfobacca acetoxidans]AEB09763.1 Cold-shock protein DNA-binding protein [Desulfobacca acetoxidans DSM 11109]